MPNSIPRESLTTDLESRYAKQKAGGAFNAKGIVTEADTIAPAVEPSYQGRQFTINSGGFRVKMPVGLSSFSDVPDRINSVSKKLSAFVKGHSNKKYKP